MAVFSRDVEFLAKKTQLMVYVKPSGNYEKTLEEHFIRDINVNQKPKEQKDVYISIHLDETLKIKFSVTKEGNISKELMPCKCSTPVLPNESLASINNVYQRISQLIEKKRHHMVAKYTTTFYFKIIMVFGNC